MLPEAICDRHGNRNTLDGPEHLLQGLATGCCEYQHLCTNQRGNHKVVIVSELSE